MIGVENDTDVVDHNDEDLERSRSHDILLGNVEIVTDDKDAQLNLRRVMKVT